MPPRTARILVVARGVGERLRDRDRVAVGLDERDRRRALEQREQRSAPAASAARRVSVFLTTVKPGAVLEELRAQLVDLAVW